MVGMKGSFFWN